MHSDKDTNGNPFSTSEIASAGRQVLEALLFIKKIGYPYPYLHSGNVFKVGDIYTYFSKKFCVFIS